MSMALRGIRLSMLQGSTNMYAGDLTGIDLLMYYKPLLCRPRH
jgi:hypothetical protein